MLPPPAIGIAELVISVERPHLIITLSQEKSCDIRIVLRANAVRPGVRSFECGGLLPWHCARGGNSPEQAHGKESGSKLPHSKASHRRLGDPMVESQNTPSLIHPMTQ